MRSDDNITWTNALDRRLMKAISDGESYLQFARTIGTTRNAIAGRVHRLRKRGNVFNGPGHAIQTANGNRNRAYRPSQKEVIMGHERPKPSPKEERKRDAITGKLPPATGNKVVRLEGSPEPVTILDLKPGQCKAAVGDEPRRGNGIADPFVFCGAPIEEGSPYCVEHGRFMYQRSKTRIPGSGGMGMSLERLGISKGA